jgi:hypothetical protein
MGAFVSSQAHVKKAFSVLRIISSASTRPCSIFFSGNSKHSFIPQIVQFAPARSTQGKGKFVDLCGECHDVSRDNHCASLPLDPLRPLSNS